MISNGSCDGTNEYLEGLGAEGKVSEIIINRDNLGAPRAFNQGIEKAGGEFIVFLNNDTAVSSSWAGKMRRCLEKVKSAGLAGPVTNPREDNRKNTPAPGGGFSGLGSIQKMAAYVELTGGRQHAVVPGITSFCMMSKREVVEKIGGFDEAYGRGTNDDHDFCLRALKAGYRIICALGVYVYHFYNTTLGGLNIEELDIKNREYFVGKFGKQGLKYLSEIGQPYGKRGERPFNALNRDRRRYKLRRY